jgi:hypothetical protein
VPLVSTLEQLKDRIKSAEDGDVIYLQAGIRFDFSYEPTLVIGKRVTLMSDFYGLPQKRPVFFSGSKPLPLLLIQKSGVVIKGIRIEGIETDSKIDEIKALNRSGVKGVYQFPVTRGIEIQASDVRISDCELSGFSHSAIFLTEGASAVIERNSIHHNQRWGLGYGVALHQKSQAIIQNNHFDFNWHSIAGSGSPGQEYEARSNWFGKNHNDSPLDMHGGADRKDGTQIAGKRVHIHHNKIEGTAQPIFIHRGIAQEWVSIDHNQIEFKSEKESVSFSNGITKESLEGGHFRFYDNEFGVLPLADSAKRRDFSEGDRSMPVPSASLRPSSSP